MRHHSLISILLLAAAGCSASGDDLDPFAPGAIELPDGEADELVNERDPSVAGGGYGILLLDTTSSMTTVRPSTGNTRCYDAKVMARGYIYDFFDPTKIDGDGIAVFGFTNNTAQSDDVQPAISGYYTDTTSAIAAVNALSCEGSTPLADALCKGVNGDGETFTLSPLPDRMFVLTDGFENNSNGPCSGFSGGITVVGSWQYKVYQEMLSTGVMVSTRYWVDPTGLLSPISIDSFAAAEDEPFEPSLEQLQIVADIEELPQARINQLMSAVDTSEGAIETTCDTVCQELELFEAMAQYAGGSWGVVKDDDAAYPVEDTVDPATGPVHPSEEPPPPEVGGIGS